MATYAAFKHVELYNVGKAKKRVLRPPGGGSSDIFGNEMPATPRSAKNHMASNIFGNDQSSTVKNNGDSARRAQKNVDSYSRLFGEPDRPFTPAKNHMKSSIPIGGNGELKKNGNGTMTTSSSSTNGSTNGTKNGNGHKFENGSLSTTSSSEYQNGHSKTDGNPVTGEGYKPAGAEINTTIPCLNGANQVINKNRIPPGGFSSGLW